ncbi:MAG: hypothetical protein LC131_12260 [Anaerolineae bacterium]|nr:hypothetical protein [Promineifilum sp.]MCZ2114587.1 hypothetical protein [Anaerolineae bacterium]
MTDDTLDHTLGPLPAGAAEPGDDLTELVPFLPPSTAAEARAADSSPATAGADPEFDAYMAVVRLLIGGSVEAAAELVKRLEQWEAELDAAEGAPKPGEIHNTGDAARYMLVGMALSAGEGARQRVMNLVRASDVFWRLTGSVAQPLVDNRLTGLFTRPFDRAIDRLVNRGQKRVNDWIELGRTQEPGARRIARKTYEELVDEFIGHLAENQELAGLVQKKSIGLANEAVDELRSRTVSADAMAENIVRRILRRPPRSQLPQPPEDVRLVIVDGVEDTP